MSEQILGLPAYSREGLSARDIFFVGNPGLHFFVEDDGQENLYELLMRRCFPNAGGIEIFPQGGKSAVIDHVKAQHRGHSGIRRIYVVDKDFDDILGDLKSFDGLFYLEEYGVENLIFDERALVEICVQESPKNSRKDLAEKLSYQAAMDHWLPTLDRLHRAFLLVQKFSIGIPNTSSSVDDYVHKDARHRFDNEAVEAYLDKVKISMRERGLVVTDADFNQLIDQALPDVSLRNINGKFLFCLAYQYLKFLKIVKNLTMYSLVYRCAGASELNKFKGFVERVEQYLTDERRAEPREGFVSAENEGGARSAVA